ncbi:hypothetical protein A7C99_4544 [Trichophyton rubrum]|uniref:N-acetyltransferase domain-containing protein n=1 Tax=Trichophyton rubrum TaxID=5551 RepID=A0A178EUW8_TRIRU|nr:hypothetical protein A7C99_4544 [Trichophyton rubrum]
MTLSVHPATAEDIPRILDIQSTALRQSGFFRACGEINNPGGFQDHDEKYPEPIRRELQTKRLVYQMEHDPGFHLLKCVDDETGEILAFAKWNVYVGGPQALQRWREQMKTGEDMFVPEGANVEGYRYCMGKLFDNRKLFFVLALLATDPAHERRGAGTLLVNWGCDLADKHGAETYLEASQRGYPVYERRGFEVIPATEKQSAKLHFDASKYTGRGLGEGGQGDWARLTIMVRKPKPTKG